jgi:hypothetical protein
MRFFVVFLFLFLVKQPNAIAQGTAIHTGLNSSLKLKSKSDPNYMFGITPVLGSNISFPIVEHIYQISTVYKKYEPSNSWHYGLLFNYNLNNFWGIHTGIVRTTKKYDLTYQFQFDIGDVSIEDNIAITENLDYLLFPLFVRLNSKPVHQFKGFLDAGIYMGNLMGAARDVSRNTKSTEDSSGVKTVTFSSASQQIDVESARNNFDYGLLFGLGSSYDLGRFTIGLDSKIYLSTRYINSNNNLMKPQSSLLWDYFIQEDIIYINHLAFTLSLAYNLNGKGNKQK